MRTRYLSLFWPVQQSKAALEPNAVILYLGLCNLFLSVFLSWTHSTKMGVDKTAENTPNVPKFVYLSTKVWDSDEKISFIGCP